MNKKTKFKELSTEKLRWRCDPCVFGIKHTDQLASVEAIIGQKRAVDAIKLGPQPHPGGNCEGLEGLYLRWACCVDGQSFSHYQIARSCWTGGE